jgi:hypothetical protein
MNGITDVTTRGDFLDRCIIIEMPVISDKERLLEDELRSYWDEYRPSVFGGLCDAISSALANYHIVKMPERPRMADFAQWVTAAEPTLGWERGSFLHAYWEKRRHLNEISLEANPLATAVLALVEDISPRDWIGTATELLSQLEVYVDQRTVKSKDWPKAANKLSNQLNRIAPSLREKGILIERSKSGNRSIMITQLETEIYDADGSQTENDLSSIGEIEIFTAEVIR